MNDTPVIWKRPDGTFEPLTPLPPGPPGEDDVLGAYVVCCPEETARKIQLQLSLIQDGQFRTELVAGILSRIKKAR